MAIKVQIKKIKDTKLPSYAHEGDAGVDLFAAEDYVLKPMERCLVSTGIKIAVPKGYEAQVRPKSGFYDYEAKYTPGQTEYLVPAALAEDKTSQLQKAALDAHNALGCDDISRVDFIMEPGGRIVCLEVNTLPGLTETSLVPKAAAAAGIGFEELVETVLTGAALKQKPKPAAKV